jgi:hypothetical protein
MERPFKNGATSLSMNQFFPLKRIRGIEATSQADEKICTLLE